MFTQIFDTHSHYTDSAFDADRHEVLSALPEAGIVHAVLAGTTLEDSTAGIALADRYDYIYAAVGIHPETAGQQPADYLAQLEQLAKHPKVVAIGEIGLWNFLFGKVWASTAAEPKFGILPFILTSVYGTAGAILLGVPVGFLTAVYLAKLAPPKVKSMMQSAVSLLAGIPSVVYGLVGMMVLVPGIRKLFHVPDGASLLAAIIVLAIMILPSIIKVTVTALEAVPAEYEDASLALGATPIETYFRVSVPAAKSGIAAAVVLGVGRSIGEAMAVMMVSGNATSRMPSLFESVRFLTTAVASEMSYSSGLQQQALFSIALVLFLFIMLINAGLNLLLKRNKEG